MKKQVNLTLWHEGCWMLELTREHPDIELIVDDICSNNWDIFARITVSGADVSVLEDLVDEYAAHGAVQAIDVLERGTNELILHTRYDIQSSIYDTIIESSLTPIRTIHIVDDREEWTLISDAVDVGTAIGTLEEVCRTEIESVTDFKPADHTSTTLLQNVEDALSRRQAEYLLSALKEGYYSWPRNVSAKELAGKHDVAGPTALEHIRKGEAVILCRVLEALAEDDRVRLRR